MVFKYEESKILNSKLNAELINKSNHSKYLNFQSPNSLTLLCSNGEVKHSLIANRKNSGIRNNSSPHDRKAPKII